MGRPDPRPIRNRVGTSGVKKSLGADEVLWYHRTFTIPKGKAWEKRIQLNFGAVDWHCEVYLNGERLPAAASQSRGI